MILFPAVDILDGRAVRLSEGKREKVTVYGDPVETAHRWANAGAKYLHIVDLNAAFDGMYNNEDILKHIAREIKIVTEIGGGLRSLDRVKYILEEIGFDRAVIGSSIVTDPAFTEKLVYLYKDKIVAGLDAKNGKLSIKGWKEESVVTPLEVALKLKQFGIKDIVFTDISRDGLLCGVNIKATKELQDKSGMNVIASGGVSNISDIVAIKKEEIYGAIIGKALYENTLDLSEALKLC